MRKVGHSSPKSGTGSAESAAATTSTSSTSSSSSSSKTQKAQDQEAAPRPLSEGSKTHRKQEKQLSGVMKQAAFGQALNESTGSSVGSAKAAAPTAPTRSPAATVPVSVNVLTHVPAGGSLANIGDSPAERLQFFDRMCAKANAGLPASPSIPGEKKMNVMVAPEWLFAKRNDPNNRAYTGKDMQEITEGLQQISSKYPNMLLVPGSVSWEIPDKANPNKTIMYNSTPVVQDGQIVHMYHKRKEGGETSGELDRWGMGRPEIRDKVESFNSSIFEHNGVSFSMEMCADQSSSMSRDEYATKFPNGKGTDIHILISEGSALQPRQTPVKNGGLVVHVDGSGPGASKVGTVTRPDVPLSQWMNNRVGVTATFATATGVADPTSPGAEPAQERMMLFSGLTVNVPKKED